MPKCSKLEFSFFHFSTNSVTIKICIGKNDKVGIDFFAAVWQPTPPPV